MPLEASAFPQEVQVAFFMFDLLPDRWDGNSGLYMGKDWAAANFLFDLYGVEDRRDIVYFMKVYENLVINARAEETERKRKAAERRAKSN